MKRQRRDYSEYSSEVLAREIGFRNGIRWVFFCIFLLGSAIFVIGGIQNNDLWLIPVGILFNLLITIGPMIFTYKKAKGMLAELKKRNLGSEKQASVEHQIKKATKIQIFATIAFFVIFGAIVGSIIADGNSSSQKDTSEKCRNCGRSTDLVAGFDYCYDCYEGFVDWQEDNWTEEN